MSPRRSSQSSPRRDTEDDEGSFVSESSDSQETPEGVQVLMTIQEGSDEGKQLIAKLNQVVQVRVLKERKGKV